MSFQVVTYASQGALIAGHLYLPTLISTTCPAVISGPGFGLVKEILLPSFCEALVGAGIACLIIDPIGFGDSTGSPRQNVAPEEQLITYGDGISFLIQQADIDPDRIGVWGISLAGGHTLSITGTDQRIKAAVAIMPHISTLGAVTSRLDLGTTIAMDVLCRFFGRPHATIPTIGEAKSHSVLNTDGSYEWMEKNCSKYQNMRNEVTVSSIVNMLLYNTASAASRISVPVLAIVGQDDTITPGKNVHYALDHVKTAEIKELPGTHFSMLEERLQIVIDMTVAHFCRHL